MSILVMITDEGFYPITALPSPSLEQQAQDNGVLNDHVVRVEDAYGTVLWDRFAALRND